MARRESDGGIERAAKLADEGAKAGERLPSAFIYYDGGAPPAPRPEDLEDAPRLCEAWELSRRAASADETGRAHAAWAAWLARFELHSRLVARAVSRLSERAAELAGDDESIVEAAALAAQRAGRVGVAKKLFTTLLKTRKKDARLLYLRGLGSMRSGGIPAARKDLEAALATAPDDPRILEALAEALRYCAPSEAPAIATRAQAAKERWSAPPPRVELHPPREEELDYDLAKIRDFHVYWQA